MATRETARNEYQARGELGDRNLKFCNLEILVMRITPTKPQQFCLLFPNIFNFQGGIQTYSKFLLQTLQNLYPQATYQIFLKYDSQPSTHQFLAKTQFHCFGKLPRWLQSILLTIKIILLGIWQKPTLVITTHLNYSIPCYWLKRLTGIPYWVVVHGEEAWQLQNLLLQTALHQADKIIAVSNYTKQRLFTEQQLNPAKISILPNTFNANRFQIAPKPNYLLQRYGLNSQQPIILTVSRLGKTSAPHKGYYQILQALVKIRSHLPNVHYLLAGKGDERPQIESLITQLNLEKNVTLTGFIPDEELCDHYNLCDVFALPSCIEGFGIVYLEALACGKPVLAGNQDGAVDPLDGGRLGCLVDPKDTEAIADNLQQILQGTYPNPLLFQPEVLRQATIAKFEQTQFRKTLARLIGEPNHSRDVPTERLYNYLRSH